MFWYFFVQHFIALSQDIGMTQLWHHLTNKKDIRTHLDISKGTNVYHSCDFYYHRSVHNHHIRINDRSNTGKFHKFLYRTQLHQSKQPMTSALLWLTVALLQVYLFRNWITSFYRKLCTGSSYQTITFLNWILT